MEIKNIVIAEKYTRNGEEKTSWNNVGRLMIKDDGKMFIKLHMYPNVILSVFDQKKHDET